MHFNVQDVFYSLAVGIASLGVGRGANNASPWKPMLRNIHKARCFL